MQRKLPTMLIAFAMLLELTGCSVFGGKAAEEPPHRVTLDDHSAKGVLVSKRSSPSREEPTMLIETLTTTWAPRILSLLRIMSAMLFMAHGTLKILGFPASDRSPPELLSLGGIAGVFELFGGALLVVGLFTRPVAFLLSGVMAFAYFIAHAPRSFFPVLNGGDAAILYCFVFLYFAFAGGGAWSIDALRKS